MNDLIKILLELMSLLPPQLVNIGIVVYLIWFQQTHRKDHKEILDRLSKEEEKSKSVEQKIEDVYMLTLKGMITNESLPVSVRMDFFDQYKGLGGNSWVDHYVEANLIGRLNGEYGRRKDDKPID